MNDRVPKYVQIRTILLERLSSRVWGPGDALPAEMALASELGASQGTVRKAIDMLVADGVLARIQGSGTFVAEHTDEAENFRFFRLTDAHGKRVVPELTRQIASVEKADAGVAALLDLNKGAQVHVLDRVRMVNAEKIILEKITVSDALMPNLSKTAPLPNALYPWYQREYGIHVVRTEEQLAAVAAGKRQARMLGVPEGTPLLAAERVAFDMNGRPVEHRWSHFLTLGTAYSVELS